MSTFGVIIGNRGFFPDVLARDGREEILRLLAEQGHKSFCLTPEESKFGSVETYADARRCAELFRSHADEIDGVVVSLPNFGDERAVGQQQQANEEPYRNNVMLFAHEPYQKTNCRITKSTSATPAQKIGLCNSGTFSSFGIGVTP